MAEVTRVSVEIAGTEISFETGRMARQASGAVVVRAGDTIVLNTATAGNVRDVEPGAERAQHSTPFEGGRHGVRAGSGQVGHS